VKVELEKFKSAWQQQSVEGSSLSSPARVSQSMQFVRASAIRDLQRSDELSRFVFCLLFALVAIGASLVVVPPGAGRVGAWLLVAALLADGIMGMALLARRFRAPATSTVMEFISLERRHAQIRLRYESHSRRLTFALATVALLVLLLAPRPLSPREDALDSLWRMVILTAFLALAWRRARLRSAEIRRELEGYLKDLEG
jgi:hypothetical protein